MINLICAIAFFLLFGVIMVAILMILFQNTDTLRAIDGKIAKLIRGKDDEYDK